VPLLTAVLFYFAFGGAAADEEGFVVSTTEVQVVNLDEPTAQTGGFSAGQMLIEVLRSEDLEQLLNVTEVDDAVSARAAVDNQAAGVAVITPADFTAAALGPEGHAAIEVYQDPTLSLGPGIVRGIVRPLVDGFAGSKIAAMVAHDQLNAHGVTASLTALRQISLQYADWSTQLGEGFEGGANPLLDVRSLGGTGEESPDMRTEVISQVLAGMMVFYVFFTGASSAQSILQEEEAGTLPRLFTTPTRQSTILGAKFLATFVTLLIQVVVLVGVSALVFGIRWGAPLPVVLVTVGLVVMAASFGIFITSLLTNSRQAGIVYGGVMTVLGMVAMMRTFTALPGTSQAIYTVSLFVPQGWGVWGWQVLLAGGGLRDVGWIAGVMLALGVVFFAIGVLRFQKRFA
jgi:ABC-2 type transport system permease protein